jgi:CBS domain-containing protein
MLVRDVMKGEVLSISPFTTLAEASQIFSQRNVLYLVVKQGNDVQGILSLTDLDGISEDARQYIRIEERMMRTPACIAASSNLEDAKRLIEDSGIKALPVCQNDTLVGIVTLADIQEFLSRK